MPDRRTLLRLSAASLSAAAVAPLLAACGGASAPTANEPGAAGSPAGEAAFPVTLTHKYGETTIESAPERVVLVGLLEQDMFLALGVVPVAVTDWFVDDVPGRIYPWATDALGGAELPEVLDGSTLQIERIAALSPDLIFGQYTGMEQREYDLLSGITATVAQPADYVNYGVPWDECTLAAGESIGRRAEAEQIVAEVEQQIADAADPAFAGKTAVVLTNYEGIYVYGPEDPRTRLLADLGFVFPEALNDPTSESFGWSISPERANELADIDVVVWIAGEDQANEATGGAWAGTAAAQQGRAVYIDTRETPSYATAFSFVTPLSIPYVLERYVPQLKAAVDGDPTTEVPPAQD